MPKKFKIVLASETYPPDVNGAAVFVQRLARMLSSAGHKVLVIAPSPVRKDKREKLSENLEIFRVKTVPLKPVHPYFRAVWKVGLKEKLGKVMTEFNPDLIHIHNHLLLGRTCLKFARKNKVPVLGTNHFMPDNLTEYFPGILEKPATKLMWKDFIKVYNKLDYVTAPTKSALNMILKLGLDVPSQVISNGLDLSEFGATKVKQASYKKFHLDPDRPTFLFVGRLEQDKNIDLVLEALEIIKTEVTFQMLIVGIGKDEKRFKKLAKNLKLEDHVHFTGKLSDADLKQAYAIADVYIGSGSAELQGLAVMEAMANGLPVLAANAVALPELVEDGKNGFLFELDPNDLAKKMRRILKNPKKLEPMSEASLKIIGEHSQERTLSLFEEVYIKLLQN